MESQSLEEIIKATAKDESKTGIFNNAAQVWNHTFFWNCMKPNGGGKPTGDIAQTIDRDSAASTSSRSSSRRAAVGQFGSGWAWLVADGGKLQDHQTPNAVDPDGPGSDGAADLRRLGARLLSRLPEPRGPISSQTFLDHLINWDFVAQNLAKAKRPAGTKPPGQARGSIPAPRPPAA